MQILGWIIRGKLQELGYNILTDLLAIKQSVIVSYYAPRRAPIYRFVRKVIKESKAKIIVNEGYQLAQAVIATRHIEGDIAEVGVYTGGSAKIISHYRKKRKKLYLFDTWEGLPQPSKKDSDTLRRGVFKISLDRVRAYFTNEENVYFHRGLFPSETGRFVKNKHFSFVNLDADLYDSTLDSLRFFYPRLNKGAILISHDYSLFIGVYNAFNEFFKDKPESIIELSGSQCLIVKL